MTRKGSTPRRRRERSSSFTGVDDPYEVPESPDLVIEGATGLDDAIEAVVAQLHRAEAAP